METEKKVKRKQCNECGQKKELSEFHVRRASWDGRQEKCKVCQIAVTTIDKRISRERAKAHRAAEDGVAYGGKIPDAGDMWRG